MFVLATASDVKLFIREMSPHVKKIIIKEECYGNNLCCVMITIKLSFLYGLLYGEKFFKFINPKIQERKLHGIDYLVVVE